MATITKSSLSGPGAQAISEVTLTATNTLAYEPGTGQILYVRNPTAAAVTLVLDGADGTVFPVQGLGNIDVTAGYSASIAAGAVRAIKLDTISAYLQGVVAVTGTGLVAALMGI